MLRPSRSILVSFFVALFSAVGAAQIASFSPSSLAFANQAINTSATPKTVTLTNTGVAALNITGVSATGDFTQMNNCSIPLAPKAKCSFQVNFTPTATGTRSGSLVISDNAGTGTQTISLRGAGVTQVSLSASSISFGTLVVGVTSASKAVTLTNNLSVPLSISGVTSSTADFSVQSGCAPQIPAKGTCSMNLTFTPTTVGARTGQVTITDSASPSTQIVKLGGSGAAVKLLSISVLPAGPSVPLGTTQQFRAIGSYNNNTTQDLTNAAVWTSSAAAVATISNLASSKGLLNTTAPGSTTVSAKKDTVIGSTTVNVVAALTSIVVSPATATVPAGTPQQFTATGNYNDGSQKDLTASVNWSSSNNAVASIGPSGLAATASAGQVNISASFGSVAGAAQLTVQPAALTSLAVTPASVYVGVGSNRQYSAIGSFTDGTTKDMTHSVLWSTSNPAVATVDNFGLGTSNGAGSAMISANAGTISGSATMNGIAGGFVDCDARILDMKVLVVTQGQAEPDFPAITGALDYLGTPYTVFDMNSSGAAITPNYLANGCHGYFQGVIFAIAGYRYSITGMPYLDTYEHDFQVRHLNWFAYPDTNFGLNTPGGSVPASPTPYPVTYTAAGATVFPYANTSNPLPINYSQIYLSSPYNGAS
ncbi:MAG: choice-of-anchor D domain-containing protein, partial [Acidobacteriota bacterium]|nr:choice-of-anchor D domain-containing protein [Acidobacteriota bacterium]